MTTNDQFPIDRTDEWEERQDAGRQVEAVPMSEAELYALSESFFAQDAWDGAEPFVVAVAFAREFAESTSLRLREELERAQVASECAVKQMQAANAEIAQLRADCVRAEAELKELRSALQKYGRHAASCRSRINSCLVTCDCGFDPPLPLSLEEKKGKV